MCPGNEEFVLLRYQNILPKTKYELSCIAVEYEVFQQIPKVTNISIAQ